MVYQSAWNQRAVFMVATFFASVWAVGQDSSPPQSTESLKNPIPMGEDSVMRGKEAYVRFCADCHGADGGSREGWLGKTDGAIYSLVRTGASHDVEALKKGLSDTTTWDLLNYLRSLGPSSDEAQAAPSELVNPFPYSEPSVKQGRQVYVRFCVTCHGADGRGQTDMVEFLSEPPSDLTNGKWKYGGTDGEIFRIIREGTPNDMESFKDRLTDERMWHVVNYLRRLGPQPE